MHLLGVYQHVHIAWKNHAKLLRIMRLTAFLLLVASLHVAAKASTQTVTLTVRNASVQKVFKEVIRQTGVSIVYEETLFEGVKPVTLQVRKASIAEVMAKCLKGTEFGYRFEGEMVVLTKSASTAAANPVMKEVSPLFVVTGKVLNEDGSPLEGVSIKVKGSSSGTATNRQGDFSISVEKSDILEFSYIGYETQEHAVGNRTVFNVTMALSATSLGEVVVNVGYGSQKKATLTGSVASVMGKELQRSPAINIANTIEGILPGAIAMNTSGEPGRDNPTVLIRGKSTTGSTAPLIVVDGVPDDGGWQNINSNDIESVSVLKDASAAIYGARAANGVILITTKRGSKGKPIVSYTFNQGITQAAVIPKMASSASFAEYVNYLQEVAGQAPRYTEAEIQKFRDGSDPINYPNVNWFKEVVKPTTPQSQHNLNVRGGNEDIKYSISGSFSNQQGMFKNGSHNFKTYTVRSNMDIKVNEYIKVGLDLNGGLNNGNYPAYSTSVIMAGMKQVPFIPVYWPNGSPSAGVEQGENPAVMVTDATGNNNKRDQRLMGKASIDIAIPFVKGLGIDGYFAYNDLNTNIKNWQTPWTVYSYNSSTDVYTPITGGRINAPQLTQSLQTIKTSLVNVRIKYDTDLGDSRIGAFIAGEQSRTDTSFFQAFRQGYLSSALDELFAGGLTNQQTTGFSAVNTRNNLFGRLSYGYQSKYLLDLNFRYDGSSNFPAGNRYGFFPGASAAWRLSQENFISENLSFVNELKLRASYGKIGNDRILPFQDLVLYNLGNTGYNFGWPSASSQGLVAGVSPNPNVTWEVLETSNFGLDGALWNDLFGFSIDVFQQKRSNILTTRDLAVPLYTGLRLPSENIGIVQNRGIELSLTSQKTIGQIFYRVGVNIAYAKSKVIDLSEAQNVPEYQKAKGRVVGADKYYKAIGIFRTQDEVNKAAVFPGTVVGNLQYEDVNGDGVISAADMVMMDKSNIPQLSFGANINLEYKNFSLYANFAGHAKAWQQYILNVRNAISGFAEVVDNRYKPGSMDSKYPILPTIENTTTGEVDGQKSDFWLMNTSFFRLKTLQLGYTVPTSLVSKAKLNSLRFFVSGSNLFTISKLAKMFDPEIVNLDPPTSTGNPTSAGNVYPQTRIFNFGVNLTF